MPALRGADTYICHIPVSGERLVTTGAIVQFVVKLRLLPSRKDSALLRDGERVDSPARDEETSVRPGTSEEDEVDLDSLIGRTDRSKDKEGKQPIGFARAPHFLDVSLFLRTFCNMSL